MSMRVWILGVLLSCSAVAVAATPAVLIGPQLAPRPVHLQGLSDGMLSYFDADRTLQTQPLSRFLQIRAIGQEHSAPPATPPQSALLELTDGQRLTGQWAGATEDGQSLRWRHPLLGEIQISLEQIRTVVLSGAPAATENAGAADRIVLVNGDTMEGFIQAVRPAAIELQLAGQAAPSTLPLDRLRSIYLTNPAANQPATTHHLLLRDGTRVQAQDLNLSANQMQFTAPLVGRSVQVQVEQIQQIDLLSRVGRLIPLAELPMTVQGGQVFGLPTPPRIDGPDLWLHAPVAVTFKLPPNSKRLALLAQAAPDADSAAAARAWADFELLVRQDSNELARHRLSAQQDQAHINVPLVGDVVTIELLPGVNGPVMDRCRLRQAVVLVAR